MGLDIVELVMTVEEAFDFAIPDRDAERLRTVGDLYWYVREHAPGISTMASVSPETHTHPPTDEIWKRLLDIIEKEAGVDRARLTPTARFVDDLGMD
jgi:acyl carrier protein